MKSKPRAKHVQVAPFQGATESSETSDPRHLPPQAKYSAIADHELVKPVVNAIDRLTTAVLGMTANLQAIALDTAITRDGVKTLLARTPYKPVTNGKLEG